jgi:pyridoxal 5'-phosphate synthase pdxT subunit
MKIGILAVQGAFAEHISALNRLDAEAVPVRLPRELKGLDGLVIPGGESTTICKMMVAYDLTAEIEALAKSGFPVFGTCAGMVLMAENAKGCDPKPMGLMDFTIKRNAFGRQRESFEVDIPIPALGKKSFHAVFIRAPAIAHSHRTVEILARLADGTGVAARQGKLLVSAFHPELTDDLRFHKYFMDIISGKS